MIKKLKRRYLITNMTLLSCTLLVFLGILFAVLYHSQVQSSYTIMNELIEDSALPAPPPGQSAAPTVQEASDAQIAPLMFGLPDDESNASVNCDPNPFAYYPYDPYTGWYSFGKGYMSPNFGVNPPPYWFIGDPNENCQRSHDRDDDDNKKQEDEKAGFCNPPPGWENHFEVPPAEENGEQEDNRSYNEIPPPVSSQTADSAAQTKPTETRRTEPERRTEPSDSRIPPPPAVTQPQQTPESSASKTTTTVTTKESSHSASASTAASRASSAPVIGGFAETETTTEPAVRADEGHYIPHAYVAKVDEAGNIESFAGSDSSEPDDEHFRHVHSAVDSIRREGHDSGTIEIDKVPYRYIYQKDRSGSYQLVLLNRTLEISTLTKMLVIFILLAAAGLICMFILSNQLANWTVTPIAKAWEKQKQFVADASHELKTPLAVISANTEVIRANPGQQVADQSKWLSYIQSETMRMNKLITNLLTVARMDDSTRQAAPDPIRLSELVSSVCLVFEPVIYEHGKTLNTVIQRNVMLPAEEDNLKQLLSILLDNAILHSVPKADINVTLSKDTQGKIRLAVSNTAEDIPDEQLAHLFDRFYRLDTKGSPNGSGLGLSIAKSIVHQMGGILTVTSENHLVTFVATF